MNAYDHYHCNTADDVEPDDTIVGDRVWRANLCATFLGNLVYPTPASKMLHFP